MGRFMYLKPLHLPKASILVLAEDSALRTSLRGLLSGAGYALAENANGTDSGRIDLVLASLGAWQTSSALRDLRDRSAPVILLIDRKAWTGFDFFDLANDLGAVA